MQDLAQVSEAFRIHFEISIDDELRLAAILADGYHVVVAGVTYWYINPGGDLLRVTRQIHDPLFSNIADCTQPFYEMHEDLDGMEDWMIHKYGGQNKLDKVLWFYVTKPGTYEIGFKSFVRHY